MPASPNDVVQSNLVLPSQSDPFEAIPFRRGQLLSGTNSNAHMSYLLCVCVYVEIGFENLSFIQSRIFNLDRISII